MREKPSSVGAMASMNCDGERYLYRVSGLCLQGPGGDRGRRGVRVGERRER
jgi:hypothetical protein